jgi:hypothetical protein
MGIIVGSNEYIVDHLDGHFSYSDAATSITPLTVTGGGGDVVLTNDTLGANTMRDFKPCGVPDVWNPTTNRFDFSDLALGDEITIRMDLSLITTSPNTEVNINLHLADDSYVIPFLTSMDYKTAKTHIVLETNRIFIGNLGTLNGGGFIAMNVDKTCTVEVHGWYCSIKRYNRFY